MQSRRQFMAHGAQLLGGAVLFGPLLAACGDDDGSSSAATTAAGGSTATSR